MLLDLPVSLLRSVSAAVPSPPILGHVARAVLTGTLVGSGRAAAAPPPPAAAEPGEAMFGPGSASWDVLGDIAALVGGLRALIVQTQHPMVMDGVARHSEFRTDPLGRLQRTVEFVATTTYGTPAQAQRAADQVRAIHARVAGVHGERHWRADDPDLLDWVHCALLDSMLATHRAYAARPISRERQDRFVAEQAQVAEMLGDDDPPRSVAALRTRLAEFEPVLEVGAQAQEALRFLQHPPLPAPAGWVFPLIWTAAVATLPVATRVRLGVSAPPGAVVASQVWLAGTRVILGPPPREVRAA